LARGALLAIWAAACAALSARADDLAIAPDVLPVATQMVAYAQTFTPSGGSGSYNWSVVPWTYETAEPTYSVGANETPLWDGSQMKGNTAYKLPFTFPYCGTQYDTIYLDSHGFLMFDPNYSSSDYAYKSYLSYGYTGLAVLWKNSAYASGWVDTSVEGQVSFRFEMSYESGDTTYTWAHKTTLYSDGRIRFAYRQDANDSVPDNFAIGLAVGNMRADYSYASLPLAGDGDAIPSNDFVFMTYGIAEGFSWSSSYYDYSTYQYVPCLYGQSKTAGPVPFALKVTDSSDGSAVTNFYDFVIVENPDKEPVIDAVSPVTTNVFHQLSIGDTMDFHVDAHDLADGPFDINWVFYRSDGQYSASTNIGTGADFTFTAARELYDFQYSSGESVLKCIVSDAFWTNTVTWRVSIRRDTYIDATAAEDGNGTEASPYNNLRDDYLKFGDKIIIAPGRYELDYMNLGSKGLQFVSTGTMDDTTIAFTSGYSLSGNYGARASFTGFTFENVQGASYVNFTSCSLSGIKSRDYGIQDCDLTGCYVWGCSVSRNLFTDCKLKDCTVAGNEFTATVDEYGYLGAIGSGCRIENTIVVNNIADDGTEANFNTDEWSAREMSATNCCTIPAMTSYGPGNFEAHPSFVYATMGDLRLRAGSACLADNPANNTGAYKGPGVEGFIVHAFTDPVRGILSDGCDLQIVPAGETAYVMVKPLTDRAFLGWVTNGVEVAGATEIEFAIENIDCDYEVEALFEYKEFYVNPTEEDDTGDGSAAQPKRTVAAAAALAIDGETIHLAEGTYEPFAFKDSNWNGEMYVSETRALTFIGAGAGKTIIDGGGTNTCVRLTTNMTLKNASLVNGTPKDYAGGGFCGGTLENCVVSNCMSTSRYTCYGAVYEATVVNSLIVNNVNTNSTYSGRAGGVNKCKVYNSTIANNLSTGYPGGAYYSHLKNCIVYGNTARSGYSEYNEVMSCQNESLSTGVSDSIAAQSNLIGVDPWFVDAANGDWRLIAGSPAIDVGENVPQVSAPGALDLAGERRIRNGIVDYGCYEGGVVTAKPAAPVATGTSAKAAKGLPFVWSAVPNAAEYRIYRGTSDNVASATQVGTTTATNYLDLATTGGTDYFYWVSAWNSQFGESEKCGPIAVTSYADLKIETASLPAATEAVPYSVQLECSGNVGTATWSLPYAFVTRSENTFAAATGVLVDDDWPTRDGSYQHNPIIMLPFTFTWFGEQYDRIRLSEHGAIAFGDTGKSLSWSYYAIDETPKIAVLEGVSGWGDYTTISEIRVDSQSDYVKISWKGKSDGYTAEFSATLCSDNTVRLSYGSCRGGGYIAYSNGSDESVVEILRKRADFSNMDDIVITGLPNDSGLAISEGGLLSGIIDFAGTYLVSALVTDSANGDTAYKTFTLTVNANANTRPVIDAVTPDEDEVLVLAGDSQAFSVAAHDPESAALSYSWYLDDALVSTAGASWTFAVTDADLGRHTLVCEVADALWTNGQVYAEWEVSVAQKLYVDAVNGTTNGTGTAESPFKTLQQAEGWIGGGETVFVAPGTYAPIRVWGGGFAPVTFRATGSAAETIIDGGGNKVCVDDYHCSKNFTFVGFTLRNGGDEDYAGTASYGVNLKDCVVTGCKSWRCTIYGADVENCQIYGNTALRHGAAVGFCNVVNSLIYGNTSGETGVVYRSTLDRCTVYGNTALVGGGLDGLSTADHSIVWGNTATADASTANYEPSTNGVQFTYSCTTPLPEGEGNIAVDPQFVNAAGGDFHLANSSPCLEAGMGCYAEGGGEPVVAQFTVTFDANGGTCAEATRTVAKGKAVGTLPQATRAGYTLKGWYTAKSGGTQVTAATTITKDITFYAQWTEIPTYTVTFDANGGTCATKTMKVAQGEAVGELPEATRDGFKLAGWFTAKTGGSLVTEATTVTKNITYYARWTEYYELTIEDGVLTGLTGTTPATIDVPATVTGFAADLFKGVAKITAATGGANVTKCGAGAFRDSGIWKAAPNGPVVVCGVLVGYKGTVPATVDVPYGVKVIADGAFANAANLVTVYLPDSLVSIGAGAFAGCAKLDDVDGIEDVASVAADAFEGTLYATFRLTWSGTVVTGFKGPCPAEIVIPDNATGIGIGAFQGQTEITAVTLGANVATVGANAFKGCTGLGTVAINCEPPVLTTIGVSAFEGCAALAAIDLPASVATIGASAFKDCTAITAIHLPASLTTIGESVFAGCTSLAAITGGEGVEVIRTSAFDGTPWYAAAPASEFEEVMLGHVLVRMKGEVPASYEISTNVWMVANNAFAGVTTLSDLYIGTEVVSLWDRAFAGCTSLGSVTVPSGCRELGDYLFEGCTSLTNVFFRGHAPTNDVPHVFAGTPATLTVRVKEGSRGWIAPGSDSNERPARWPNRTFTESGRTQPVPDDLSRALYSPAAGEAMPGDAVYSVIVDGTITNDTTWAGGTVYEVQRDLTIDAGATLTLQPGAIVKFGRGCKLTVVGMLEAQGTSFEPVVFTSLKDDAHGGDTNGDGARSDPFGGDWRGIMVGGDYYTYERGWVYAGDVNLAYAKMMYAGAGNETGIIETKTPVSTLTMTGCLVAHSSADGIWNWGGKIFAKNCVVVDTGWASAPYQGTTNEYVNCVFYDNNVGMCHWSGWRGSPVYRNCVFAKCTYGWCELGSGKYGDPPHSKLGGGNNNVSVENCLFWNAPDDPGLHSCGLAGKNGNLYGDPLFLDPENGDFRISVESPCVDAAYGDVAPELDYYGQPRMDVSFVRNTGSANAEGVFPDIGIYEVPGTTERPVMNLEVESVSFAPASAAPGETLTVTYTVRNTGNTAAKGSIRDVVRIKSAANGGTMTAGTATQLYDVGTNETATFTARVAVPSAPAGEWLVGIDVNPNRDVFEQNFLKNALWTEDAVEVTLPEMTMGMTGNAAVPAATTVGYMLKDVPEEGGIVVITAAGTAALPVIARVATGHMPTPAMNDAVAVVIDSRTVALVIPPHAAGEAVYLAIENSGITSATVDVAVQPLATELWAVYPETAANVGDMGFTFTGSGLTAESDFRLGGIRAKSATAIDSANVYAVFDVQNIAADRYYDVSADGKTIRDAVYVNKVAKGPILEAKLELPERTRDNRVYTGYVVYENKGDTQMNAPTFIINIADAASTNTVIGAYDDDDDNLTLQRVLIVGVGSSHPAGVLKPGDSGRLPFKFKPVGSYQFKLDSRYTSDEVADAVTRMNLRGGPVRFDGSSARGLANLIKKGEEAAAVSGWLLDSRTREPLANAGLGLMLQTGNGEQGTGNGEEPFVRTATTDENGYFSFEQLRDGAYQLSADVGYVLVTTNLITVTGQADVNGYEATALPPGEVTGYAMSDDGNPIQYGEVTLYAAAGDMVGTTVKTDGYGAYRFTGLEDGAYTVYAKPFESFRGVMVTNVVIEASGRERRIDMELKRTARAYGTVTMYGGGTAVDGEVRLYDDEGNFLKADVATNGVWEAAGIPVGEYSFAYVSEDGALDSARVVAAFAQGDEREIALTARPAIMFRASTRFGAINVDAGETLAVRFAATGYANNTNVVAVQWDFGDGEPVEVDEVETTHTYATTGYKTVRLRPKFADGTYGDWDETENYILVSAPVETIYKANAIVLQGFDDAGAVTNAGTLVVTGVGTNWLELAGTGGIPLEAGVVIAGSYTNAENEADWFVRKVVAVSGDAGGWRLATEYGDEDDLYEQYWSNWGLGAVEDEDAGQQSGQQHSTGRRILLSSSNPSSRRLLGEGKKKGFGDRAKSLLPKIYGEGGVTFNIMCSPDISCFYSYYRLNIKGTNYVTRRFRDYHEMVPEVYGDMHRELRIFGDASLTANIDISAEYSGGWKKEYQYDLLPKVMKAAPQAAKVIPHFTIKAEAAGKIGGSLHGEASINGYIDIGFTKETGKKIQWHKPDPFKGHVDMSFETAGEKEAAGKLHASVGAGFGVTMKVFEVLSATADVTFSAKAEAVIPSKGPSKASINIGYDTEIAMNFIDFSWLNADWKVGLDWSIEGLSFWGMEWISPEPSFIYRQPHEKEWPARITVTDRSKTGTFVRNNGRTEVLPISSVSWDYGQGQTFSYDKSQIDNGTYKRHRIIEFQEEGEYTVSLNVQGGIMPNIFPCQKKIKIKKPEEDEIEEQTKIQKEEWFSEPQNTQQSYDPNEMAGPLGVGEQRYVKPGEPMTYTIYFENKADAAIAAQEVFVDNVLSEYLDWSTFEMKTVSVGGQILDGLDGWRAEDIAAAGGSAATEIDQTNGLYKTRVEVQYDATEGIASWYIRVVDAAKRAANDGECWPDDPDAGVLQPNVVSPEGEGYIVYSVKVREDAPANAVIDNSANIVFDQNAAIVTDPAWWNTVAGSDVGFADAKLEADEGDSVKVRVMGGNIDKASHVQLYVTYNTATSADLDLANAALDGVTPKGGLKFPLTLSWAKGEIGEKVITIPVKTDKTVEGDEFFTLQLAAPNGMTAGDASVFTVTIHDTTVAAGKETLQDAVNNAVVKMSTAGKGKWAYSSVGTGDESEPGKTASASAASPALKVGETADLKAGAVKGSGTLSFDVRVANDALEGDSPEAADGAAKTVLTLFDGKVALLAWTNETDWTSASYTVKEEKATSHAFMWQVVQGADTNARAYVANVVWSPADTEMRAITLSVEPAEGGTAAGSGVYPDKTKLSLVATAKVGYEFIGWYDGETLFDAKAKSSVTITNDLALTARFEKIPYIRGLADPADGGKVSGSGLCARGKKVTLKAAANKNFTFLGWAKTVNSEEGIVNSFVATTPTLVIDRTAKPAADSKTSTTITNVAEDVTYFAVFKSDPEIFVTVDATDGTGAEPTGKGAGKYVAGTITGMGKYAPGKTKIALKAAANKGYVFAGWLDANGELLTKDATYTIAAMGESDVEYTAKFVTADEDKASITLELTMSAEAEAFGLSTNEIASVTNFCGVAMNWRLAANGLSATTIKVAGLPSGLKFTAKDIMKKGSKTEVEIPANTIYGAPTAASKTDKNGNVTPSKVVFTVTTAGKSTQTFAINLYIAPLPAWAVGTFDGATYAGDSVEASGLVQAFTVAVNGKISGKLLRADGTWTLAADSFASYDAENDAYLATVIGKNGKLLETNEVTVAASGVTGTTLSEAAVTWTAYQNLWKRADTKADMPVIKKDIKVDYELVPGDANNKLTLTFKKDGAVAFAGKVGGASVSGSSQLVNDGEGWKVTLYAPAKGAFAGFSTTLAVALTLDTQNIVTGISIGGGDAPAGLGSWFTGEFNGYGDVQFPLVGGDTEFLNGLFAINVAVNLAFTGTFTGTDGSTASFSGTFARDGSSYVATGVSITVKGKTMSMGLMCDPQPYAGSDEGFGEIGGGSEDVQDEPCIALNCAWQNIWKRTDLAAEWKPAFAAGTEKTLDLQDTWLADLSVGDSLTYAFGADGAVSITGKIYGESVNATATLDLEGLDGSSGTMHCNFFFLANGHLYQQQFTFPRQATVTATDITLDSFVRID